MKVFHYNQKLKKNVCSTDKIILVQVNGDNKVQPDYQDRRVNPQKGENPVPRDYLVNWVLQVVPEKEDK
jgi:hypothetical protein